MTPIEEVLVLGAGGIGHEVALQCAMFGYRTTLCDISRDALQAAKAMIEMRAAALAGRYVPGRPRAIVGRIYFTLELEEAVASADLVSECAPENLELKRGLFARIGALAPPQTIFTTNSSTLVPSQMADATGRPDRFLALHFHKPLWVASLADVMPHPGTRPEVVETVVGFARSLRQRPLLLAKESPSYVFNAMMEAYNAAAFALWINEVASFEDIDRAWMIVQGAKHGPFGAMDAIGLDTMHDIARHRADTRNDVGAGIVAERLQRQFLDRGLLGVKTGRGFYGYPNPAFAAPEFLSG
jgi:3-hydroxybutyryl-CoA dehydrogenase